MLNVADFAGKEKNAVTDQEVGQVVQHQNQIPTIVVVGYYCDVSVQDTHWICLLSA